MLKMYAVINKVYAVKCKMNDVINLKHILWKKNVCCERKMYAVKKKCMLCEKIGGGKSVCCDK